MTAFNRAIRAHRRLAKLAPQFFDATTINRLELQRKEDAEWMALWEPVLIRVYGPQPTKQAPDPFADTFPLPKSPRTLRAIEREYASLQFWMCAGSLAMARYKSRNSRCLLSLSRIARLLDIGIAFGNLACGEPAKPNTERHERALADLERIYGCDPSASSSTFVAGL